MMTREASQVLLVVCKLASENSVENQFDSVLRLRTADPVISNDLHDVIEQSWSLASTSPINLLLNRADI